MLVSDEPAVSNSELTVLLSALVDLKKGKRDVRLPIEWTGLLGRVADAFNDVVDLNERMADELSSLSQCVGKEGKLGQRLRSEHIGAHSQKSTVSRTGFALQKCPTDPTRDWIPRRQRVTNPRTTAVTGNGPVRVHRKRVDRALNRAGH